MILYYMNNKELVDLYLQSLSTKEKKTYEIAEKQLGTSFSLEKSIGFIEFIKNKPPSITNKDKWISVGPPKPPKDEWITVPPKPST